MQNILFHINFHFLSKNIDSVSKKINAFILLSFFDIVDCHSKRNVFLKLLFVIHGCLKNVSLKSFYVCYAHHLLIFFYNHFPFNNKYNHSLFSISYSVSFIVKKTSLEKKRRIEKQQNNTHNFDSSSLFVS